MLQELHPKMHCPRPPVLPSTKTDITCLLACLPACLLACLYRPSVCLPSSSSFHRRKLFSFSLLDDSRKAVKKTLTTVRACRPRYGHAGAGGKSGIRQRMQTRRGDNLTGISHHTSAACTTKNTQQPVYKFHRWQVVCASSAATEQTCCLQPTSRRWP